jgi:hypothetical protein
MLKSGVTGKRSGYRKNFAQSLAENKTQGLP